MIQKNEIIEQFKNYVISCFFIKLFDIGCKITVDVPNC